MSGFNQHLQYNMRHVRALGTSGGRVVRDDIMCVSEGRWLSGCGAVLAGRLQCAGFTPQGATSCGTTLYFYSQLVT